MGSGLAGSVNVDQFAKARVTRWCSVKGSCAIFDVDGVTWEATSGSLVGMGIGPGEEEDASPVVGRGLCGCSGFEIQC